MPSPNQMIMANEKENIISQPDYSINVIVCKSQPGKCDERTWKLLFHGCG
jgi:hypothetical protein